MWISHHDCGLPTEYIEVHDAGDEEMFSVELLRTSPPERLRCDDGLSTITAANGTWRYLVVGPGETKSWVRAERVGPENSREAEPGNHQCILDFGGYPRIGCLRVVLCLRTGTTSASGIFSSQQDSPGSDSVGWPVDSQGRSPSGAQEFRMVR